MEENFENVSDCLHSPASLGSMTDLEEDTRDRVSGMIAGNIIGDMRKRFMNSAAMCWESAAEPPLPNM